MTRRAAVWKFRADGGETPWMADVCDEQNYHPKEPLNMRAWAPGQSRTKRFPTHEEALAWAIKQTHGVADTNPTKENTP